MFVWVEGATGCGLSGGPTTATELQNRPGHSGVVVVRRGQWKRSPMRSTSRLTKARASLLRPERCQWILNANRDSPASCRA